MSSAHYLSIADYAALVGVSHKTIRGMIERGELPAHRFGRVLRIDLDEARQATAVAPVEAGAPATLAPRPRRPRAVGGDFTRRARGLPSDAGRG